MNALNDVKFFAVTNPAAILDDTGATTNEIDTAGYNYCQIVVSLGATDIAMAALKVQESDTSGSGFADMTGANFSGGTDVDGVTTSLPSATDDNKLWVFEIDLRGKKRYLDLVATAGNGTAGSYVSAIAILSRASIVPTTVAGRGCGGLIRV